MKAASAPALDMRLQLGRPDFTDLVGLRRRVVSAAVHREAKVCGRYRLGRVLGAGAYGTVYEAFDPQLDRNVALKLVNLRSSLDRERVVREARMLATLSSPNVVHVYEVGVTEGEPASPWVVMELVRGDTLRRWLQGRRRDWRRVVGMLLQAARGLWAAHQAGIVHRDFKPDNALIGADGRVRVVDFGLARPYAERVETDDAAEPSTAEVELTPAGGVMGTPAYMAPEVFLGVQGPAADQYALCVTLYEGLFGRRPFDAPSATALRDRVLVEAAPMPRARGEVPSRVLAIVMRGLERRPADRFEDLGAFIAALEHAARPRRHRWSLAALGAGALLTAGWLSIDRDPCVRGEQAWVQARGDAAVPDIIDDALAEHRQAWVETEASLCRDRAEALDYPARSCLDQRLHDVSAIVDVVSGLRTPPSDAGVVRAFVSPSECAELRGDAATAPPAEDESEVDVLQRRLSSLRARAATRTLGRRGVVEAQGIVEDARALGHAPLLAEAGRLYGRQLMLVGDYDAAHDALERAYFDADRGDLPKKAAWLATELFRVDAYMRHRPDDARKWRAHAEAAFARAGIDPRTHGPYLDACAGQAEAAGDSEGAVALLREAIARLEAEGHGRSQAAGDLIGHLGAALYGTGDYEAALGPLREAAEIYAALEGPTSPRYTSMLDNIGACLQLLGRHDEALELHERAVRIQHARDPEGVELGASRGNLALALGAVGRYEDALEQMGRSMDTFVRVHGDEHPSVAKSYQFRAQIHAQAGRIELARRDYATARRMFETYGENWVPAVAQVDEAVANLDAGGRG